MSFCACMVAGCALGTDVCHWVFQKKVKMVKGQQDGPFITTTALVGLVLVSET